MKKIIATTLFVAPLLINSVLACEVKKDTSLENCGQNFRCGSFLAGQVFVMGDLKMRIAQDVDVQSSEKYTMIDLKAPGYSKQKIKIPLLGIFSDSICGQTITFALRSASNLVVSESNF